MHHQHSQKPIQRSPASQKPIPNSLDPSISHPKASPVKLSPIHVEEQEKWIQLPTIKPTQKIPNTIPILQNHHLNKYQHQHYPF